MRKPFFLTLCLLIVCSAWAEELSWKTASPDQEIRFPTDHYAHPGFKTEWWYFTGNLEAENGRRYGYQITFFKQGIRPSAYPAVQSQWVRDWFAFAHFAMSDIGAKEFRHDEKVVRGGFGEAVFPVDGVLVAQIGDWKAERVGEQQWRIIANSDKGFAVNFELNAERPPVLQGERGYSRKGPTPDRASMYYSQTRMKTTGTLTLAGKKIPVTGLSWMDREWATNQLDQDQAGWDWFSLQGDDGSDLMVYQIRKTDGSADPYSKGLWLAADAQSVVLRRDDFVLQPLRTWRTPDKSASYPVEWKVEIPSRDIAITVRATFDAQELAFDPVHYWEGAVTFTGTREGQPWSGRGYLEMTGYREALRQLQSR